MPPEIFASYSREDQDQVFPIVNKLRERGLNIWIDQEGIHGAELWSREIVNAIGSCDLFVLFLSRKSTNSKNVFKELALASEQDKKILPIYLEPTEIPESMQYQLAGIQTITLHKLDNNEAFNLINSNLNKLGVLSEDRLFLVSEGKTNQELESSSNPNFLSKFFCETITQNKFLLLAVIFAGVLACLFLQNKNESISNDASTKIADIRTIMILPFDEAYFLAQQDYLLV